MTFSRILIANRGEVAVRIIRTAAEMGIETVAIYSQDDAASLHVTLADIAAPLEHSGAIAYLDGAGIIEVAKQHGCEAIHPGWGFLSENSEFARLCGEAGLTFIGPAPDALARLGDKAHARLLAESSGVPILAGINASVTAEEAREFLRGRGPGGAIIIKAVAGGGGRGMRVVRDEESLESAYRRCQSEALNAFGNASVYVEELFPRARHIEVQVIGDGTGAVSHLWERDCSIQRSHQKVVEIAPSPALHPAVRSRLTSDAVRMASQLNYRGLGTFEFLVDAATAANDPDARYAFIEANARLQVEHTITEEIFGLDLVRAQIAVAAGATLDALGLGQETFPGPRGMAVQFRINSESIQPDGRIRPSTAALSDYRPPSGPGVRVDSHAYAGYAPSSSFDSLLAKVIVHSSGGWPEVIERGRRALRELLIVGPATNTSFLRNLLEHPAFVARDFHTTFIDEELDALCRPREDELPAVAAPALSGHTAGAKVDVNDPLAVLTFGKSSQRPAAEAPGFGADVEPGSVLAPMQGTIVSFEVSVGDTVARDQEVAILNAMKMEHVLRAPVAGVVRRFNAAPGDTVRADQLLVSIEPSTDEAAIEGENAAMDLGHIRPDLAEVLERHDRALDAARETSVARRHESGHQTARENIEQLVDPGTFVEIGPVVVAADARFSLEELVEKSPADGMIVGIASINGEHFESPAKQCMVMSYDYMVFAGTQGGRNHQKTDRALAIAEEAALPIVLFAEGGGGRAGGGGGALRRQKVEPPPPWMGGSAGSNRTFAHFARMSGLVPLVGITTGRCFAGNASLLGCCDVIIATADSNIGMGGPAMVEGGGLGVFAPEEIGPMSVQVPNGVVDIAVRDEKEGVAVARKYLSYFQGPVKEWMAPDQRKLRHVVPENRLRVYDPQLLLETLCDEGSLLELRRHFGQGMYTALGRVEGRPIGIVGNDPRFVGGAITSDGSDKAARFMQLCDAFDIPLLFLCDTPGMMVGPEVEKTALVRHCSRMFVIGANVSVPCMTIVVRKAYGLGALAMAAGSFKAPLFTVSWPTGEYGGMGLEGSVKLGYRNELAAIEEPDERKRIFDEMVADAYERGKALNEATVFGVDDVIDPADSRRWISTMLKSFRTEPRGKAKKRMAVDAW